MLYRDPGSEPRLATQSNAEPADEREEEPENNTAANDFLLATSSNARLMTAGLFHEAPGTRQKLTKEDIGGSYYLYHSIENDNKQLYLYCFNNKLKWPHSSPSFAGNYYVPTTMDDHLSEEVRDKIYRIFYAGYPYNSLGLYTVEGEEVTHTIEELDLACEPPDELKELFPDIEWGELDFNASNVLFEEDESRIMRMLSAHVFTDPYRTAALTKKSFYYAAMALGYVSGTSTVNDYLHAYTNVYRYMQPSYGPAAAHEATQIAIWRILYENGVPNNAESFDNVLTTNKLVKELVDFANNEGEYAGARIPDRGSTLEDLEDCEIAFRTGNALLRSDGTPVEDGTITFKQRRNGAYVSEPLRFYDDAHALPYTISLVRGDGHIISSQTNYGSGWISFLVNEVPESAKIVLTADHILPSDVYHYEKEGEHEIPFEELIPHTNYQHMGGCYFESFPMSINLSTEFLEFEKTRVHVKKIWEDDNNQGNTRPERITVNLLSDGTYLSYITLSEDNNWEYTFSNLDTYHDAGEAIAYSIEEAGVEGYTTNVSGNAEIGFTITNILNAPGTPELPGRPDTPEVPERPEVPDSPERPGTPEVPVLPNTPDIHQERVYSRISEHPEAPVIPDILRTPDNQPASANPVFRNTQDTPNEQSASISSDSEEEAVSPDVRLSGAQLEAPLDASPKTEDATHMGLWVLLELFSGLTLMVLLLCEKFRKS